MSATTETTENDSTTVDKLAAQVSGLDVAKEAKDNADEDETNVDPTLLAGDLLVRQAGKDDGTDVEYATSFSSLPMQKELKDAVTKKGWQVMSKIQQIGLPLFLHNPPCNLLAQAQAGTGKTGTFVLGTLARLDPELLKADKMTRLNKPQAIILAVTQELVTQIAEIVNEFGESIGVHARRVMAAEVSQGGPGGFRGGRGGARGGRGGGPAAGGRPPSDAPKAEWALAPGQDFEEQVIVGTVGKVKQYLMDFERQRKPFIDASEVRVLVLDEADDLLKTDDAFVVRDMIMRRRGDKQLQIALFSATFKESIRDTARVFVGNDKKRYHEITLRKEDLTLDKVDNFFVVIGKETDDLRVIDQLKFEAVVQIWKSLVDTHLTGQTVIFVSQRERAQALADFLRREGYEVGQIHGDMEKTERHKVFQEFRENKRPALVATNVLSRGIDNPNVTLVINVDLPVDKARLPDPETFVHRIGRSGRWTKRGASVSLVSANPRSTDKSILAEIERKLFAEVDRPLIPVQDATLVGDAITKRMEERKAKKAAAPAASS